MILSRFAVALVLIGLILLTVFVMTLQVHQGDLRVLLLGAALSGIGLLMRRRAARRRKRSGGRFSTLRRLRGTEEEELE
jgi:hypothetical protein